MADIKLAFIDSNIIANHIIVSQALKYIDNEKRVKLLNELHKKIQNSYFLLEKIKNNAITDFDFYTSKLVFCEVYSVIGTEQKLKVLSKKQIPFKYWSSMINDIKLDTKILSEINQAISEFTKIFLRKKLLKNAKDYSQIDVGKLLWEYNCTNFDGLLIAQAIFSNCDYFVTEDGRLIELMKKNTMNIKICHCQTILQ